MLLLLSSVSLAAAQNATCAVPTTAGCRYTGSTPSTQEFTGLTQDACCAKCDSDAQCAGYSFKKHFLFSKTKCDIHTSASLTKTQDSDWSCAMKPPKPTLPPAPTPPPPPFAGANWAVIIAGSSTFDNYRHQADACHAYQIVKKNGIPESNIILMMQDDVAGDKKNPFPGKLFNKPTKAGTPGVDVYAGCNIDYKGKDVDAKTFLAVLAGDAAAVQGKGNGKVLRSTAADNVFVNFADHGGGQIVEMPNGPNLRAKELVATLTAMHSKNMYRKLVFYMEACNGGSMFANLLPKDINVFATTAANPKEPSWGTYCPPQDVVDGKRVGACLGDLYSVNWMEDSDAQGESGTLEMQYEKVVKLTPKSHPQMYGTDAIQTDFVDHYQGSTIRTTATTTTPTDDEVPKIPVDQRDIELLQLFYRYLRSDEDASGAKLPAEATLRAVAARGGATERSSLAAELVAVVQRREADDAAFAAVLAELDALVASGTGTAGNATAATGDAHSPSCMDEVAAAVDAHCGGFTSYSLKYHHLLVDHCGRVPTPQMVKAVAQGCTSPAAATE